MKLFKDDDLKRTRDSKKVVKNKEILLNLVANKAGEKNLTSYKINNKKMLYIQGVFKNYLKDCELSNNEPTPESWEKYLNDVCRKEYDKSLLDVCKDLGSRLYDWIKNPEKLPDPKKLSNKKRVGADEEDKKIIRDSFEYYNISEEDCTNWVYKLLVNRNFEGGIAQYEILKILKEELKKYNNADVRLSNPDEDRDGVDLVIENKKAGSQIKFQIKKDTFHTYSSIKGAYSKSYDSDIHVICYKKTNGKIEITNKKDILDIIKTIFK